MKHIRALLCLWPAILLSTAVAQRAWFHTVTDTEMGLSGMADQRPEGQHYSGWGHFYRPGPSYPTNHCLITSGKIKLPEGFTGTVFNPKLLTFRITVCNTGDTVRLPSPAEAPENWVSGECSASTRPMLKDFVEVKIFDASGNLEIRQWRPAYISPETFSASNGLYVVSQDGWIGEQFTQIDGLPDGWHQLVVESGAKYGRCTPARCWFKTTGFDLEVNMTGPDLLQNLTFKKFVAPVIAPAGVRP